MGEGRRGARRGARRARTDSFCASRQVWMIWMVVLVMVDEAPACKGGIIIIIVGGTAFGARPQGKGTR